MAGSTQSEDVTQGIKNRNIRTRSLQYVLRAVKLYQHLQKQKDGAQAGYSENSTYGPPPRSELTSRKHRPGKAAAISSTNWGSETRESLYWLNVLEQSELVSPKRLTPLIKETKELLNVITAIILSTRGKS